MIMMMVMMLTADFSQNNKMNSKFLLRVKICSNSVFVVSSKTREEKNREFVVVSFCVSPSVIQVCDGSVMVPDKRTFTLSGSSGFAKATRLLQSPRSEGTQG